MSSNILGAGSQGGAEPVDAGLRDSHNGFESQWLRVEAGLLLQSQR